MPPLATAPVRYRIAPLDPHAHLYEVSVTLDEPDPSGQAFTLPTWIPGTYMIRMVATDKDGGTTTLSDDGGTLEVTDTATMLNTSMPPIVPSSDLSANLEPTTLPTFMPMPNKAMITGIIAPGRCATSVAVLAM